MTGRPNTGTGRAPAIQAAAGRQPQTDTDQQEDQMRLITTQPAEQQADDYQAVLRERFGAVGDLARERAATPAELIRMPQQRRTEQHQAAA